MASPYKTGTKVTTWPRNSTSGCIFKRTESRSLNRYLYIAAWCTIAHRWKEPKCPATDDCINRLHNLEYCSDWKHKGNFGTGYSVDELWGHHAKWNKPDTKGWTLTSTYIRYPGSEILSVMSDSLSPNGLNSPGQNTRVGNLSLLWGAS